MAKQFIEIAERSDTHALVIEPAASRADRVARSLSQLLFIGGRNRGKCQRRERYAQREDFCRLHRLPLTSLRMASRRDAIARERIGSPSWPANITDFEGMATGPRTESAIRLDFRLNNASDGWPQELHGAQFDGANMHCNVGLAILVKVAPISDRFDAGTQSVSIVGTPVSLMPRSTASRRSLSSTPATA